ncbi:MAG: hypothetical protein LRY73_09500 [Bacillus sp. (in: Bacteria)]|nr:hypothetical protein [Bacillus sp. (in: firmicutes)]
MVPWGGVFWKNMFIMDFVWIGTINTCRLTINKPHLTINTSRLTINKPHLTINT